MTSPSNPSGQPYSRPPEGVFAEHHGQHVGYYPPDAVPGGTPAQPPARGLAIAALILGIVGSLFGLIPITFWVAGTCGVVGLVLGLVALSRARRARAPKKLPVFGVAFSALAIVLAVVGAVIVFQAVDQFGNDLEQAGDTLSSAAPAPTEVGVPADSLPPTADPSAYEATKTDFTISLKVKSKDCFDSYGCNVTYAPVVTVVGARVDQEAGSYEITYEVRGGVDGPSIDTVEVDGGQYQQTEGFAQTANRSAKLTAVITDVETNS